MTRRRTRKPDAFDHAAQRQLCISLKVAKQTIATGCDTLEGIAARHPDVAITIGEWIAALNTIEDEIAAAAKPLSPTARMRSAQ